MLATSSANDQLSTADNVTRVSETLRAVTASGVLRPDPWLALVDSRPFSRVCISRYLCASDALSQQIIAVSIDELTREGVPPESRPSLVIYSVGSVSIEDAATRADLDRLLACLGPVPVVVLSDRTEPEEARNALAAGAMGFIATSEEAPLMCKALSLVQAGGIFVPGDLVSQWLRQDGRPNITEATPAETSSDGPVLANELTPRQMDVLEILQEGHPNKVIAARLRMTESTVKVHVRQIMRRLNAKNRTEVALLAQRHLATFRRMVC
ncbi:MAG: response regulator transcription factor [Geminicoccaceae bacterium]|jgi:DNA-binding NarL/FixJ family response regulator|nr:response regulator transcription factor [Geminicoccaceae bacterium]MCB9966235.1 response regulator transcription factor [Geminicoccaceae bacterium]HRY24829.1 response regulator transcription factor [Geminicoccaceae bacterium]